MRHPGIPNAARAALNRSGLKWRVVHKTNHDAIVVGSQVVTYVSRSNPGFRNERNILAAVNRFTKGLVHDKRRKES